MPSSHSSSESDKSDQRSDGPCPTDGSRLERLRTEIEALEAEIDRLHARIARLQRENQQLRQEATIVRLYEDLAENTDAEEVSFEEDAEVELRFYESLPQRLTIREFFRRANNLGLEGDAARQAFVRFLREDLITQAGSRLQKRRDGDRESGD